MKFVEDEDTQSFELTTSVGAVFAISVGLARIDFWDSKI